MATFDDKAKELKKLLELFKKYAEDGKYDSINLRGQHSKVASLGKLLDLENEKQVKLFHELEQEYHNIVALKKRGTASLQEVTKKTIQQQDTLSAPVAQIMTAWQGGVGIFQLQLFKDIAQTGWGRASVRHGKRQSLRLIGPVIRILA